MGIYMGKHTNFVDTNAQLFFGKMKSVKLYRKQPSAGNVLPCQV